MYGVVDACQGLSTPLGGPDHPQSVRNVTLFFLLINLLEFRNAVQVTPFDLYVDGVLTL